VEWVGTVALSKQTEGSRNWTAQPRKLSSV